MSHSDLGPVIVTGGSRGIGAATVRALVAAGLDNDAIYMSMERNMKCAVGFCGHCQYGDSFVCRDGPVFRFDRIEPIFAVREF